MGSELRLTTIAKLLADGGGSVKTGPFGTTLKASEYVSVGVPVISVGEIGYGTFRIHEKTPRVSPAVTARLADYVLQEGDIVFGRKGAVDRSARISKEQHGWFLGSDGIRLRLSEKADSRFMAFQLQSRAARNWILQHATGTTMPSLNQDVIGRIPIVLPPLPTQRAIAHILGALDDKIELNRKTNETLETMARALFQSWFVDFDPVRAKAAGRAPEGMDEATAKLFPSEFEQSELGEVPKGWKVATVGSVCEAFSGGTPSKADDSLWGGDLPWISPKVMTSIHADEAEAFVTEAAVGRGTRMVPAGAVLVMVRGMGLHQGVRVCRALRAVTLNQDVKALVPRGIPSVLLLYALLHLQSWLLGKVESAGNGTGRLPSDVLLSAKFVVAPSSDQLAHKLAALDSRIALLRDESRTLAALRDALLPKLLSGELAIRDAETFVSRAV